MPLTYWREPRHLPKNLLLPRLCGNRLRQKLSNLAGIQMINEAPDAFRGQIEIVIVIVIITYLIHQIESTAA
jgi:hypothetical protein